MAAYKDGYRAIDSSTNFKLDEEAIQEFRKKLASNYEDTDEYTGKIRSVLSEVSDISDVGMPDSNGVFDIHEQMDSDLIKLVSNVNSYERENVVRLENSVELLLENLQSCLSKIGLSQCAIESYETGSFITGKDAGALNTGIKIFGDLHEKNKEAYDEIYETEQKIKDEAEKRKTQGIWRTVGGAVLIATGVACIVLTGGAAIPIVADVAVAVGSGTAVFGVADAIEGTQDIYYGSTGDIDSTAVNGIKDDLFQGNEDAYYLTENAFAFAASAMIPIGQASTAGNLTFKSTATIVAKEGISMGAGAGAQKITTDVTGNDTAGMVAGMVASGVTAKGLNGIEAEANKLAKAPKGIDGVTEGAGNLTEDVGKAGKGLEGAAKGAESAAEDAGKVVESGKYSSLRELMSPEEIARYDAYWNKVAGEKLTSVGNQKAFEILETQSKKSAGPCLSTIYDPELDNFYFGQNFKSGNKMGKVEYINWLNNDADIIIKERTDLYQYEIDNEIVKIQNPCHDDRLAAHSEIRALDQALAARRELGYTVNEETLKELYLYNIDLTELYKNNIIIPKPRCENCSRLTDGINTVIHN